VLGCVKYPRWSERYKYLEDLRYLTALAVAQVNESAGALWEDAQAGRSEAAEVRAQRMLDQRVVYVNKRESRVELLLQTIGGDVVGPVELIIDDDYETDSVDEFLEAILFQLSLFCGEKLEHDEYGYAPGRFGFEAVDAGGGLQSVADDYGPRRYGRRQRRSIIDVEED
jgi:hypothetical protein